MAHTFEIPFKGDPESIINRAKSTIEKAEGTLEGNAAQGNFQVPSMIGEVKGSYTIENSNLVVTITDKPVFAPYSMIEDALKKYLA